MGSRGLRRKAGSVCSLPWGSLASPDFSQLAAPFEKVGNPMEHSEGVPDPECRALLYLLWWWNGAGVVPKAGDLFSQEFAVCIWSLSKSL